MDNNCLNDVEMKSTKVTASESAAHVSISSGTVKCSPVTPMSSIKVPNPSPRNICIWFICGVMGTVIRNRYGEVTSSARWNFISHSVNMLRKYSPSSYE